MKSDLHRTNRAADEVAQKIRTMLQELRPSLQQKHSLSPALLEAALLMGFGQVAEELQGRIQAATDNVISDQGNRILSGVLNNG